MVRKFFRAATGLACLALFSSAAVAQGDDCTTAIANGSITDSGTLGVVLLWPYSTVGFTIPGPVASCNGIFDTADGYFYYTAGVSGICTMSTCPGDAVAPGGSAVGGDIFDPNDTILAVFSTSSCPLGNFTDIACSDTSGACGGAEATVSFSVLAGNTYYIDLGDWAASGNGFTGNLAVVVNGAVANDEPCGALAAPYILSGGTSNTYAVNFGLTNVGSTTGLINLPTCNETNFSDVWYTYTPTANCVLIASTCSTEGGQSLGAGYINGNHVITIWDDNGNPCTGLFTQMGCNIQDWRNNFSCNFGTASRVKANVNAGQTYYISVIGFLGNTGTYDLAVGEFAHAPGDGNLAAGAISIPSGGGFGLFVDTTSDSIAADTVGPPSCMGFYFFGAYGPTNMINGNFTAAYFTWTAPCLGGIGIISNCATNGFFGPNDTCLDVFDNDPATIGVQVGCNDDAGTGPCGAFTFRSFLQFAPIAGTTYYIRQGGWNGNQGPITFDVHCKYAHRYTQPLNAGDIVWESVDGPQPAGGIIEFNAITVDIQHVGLPAAVNFPNGWFFGIPLSFVELIIEAGSGTVPFWDYTTTGAFVHFTGGPGTVTFLLNDQLQSVGVALDPATGFSSVLQTTDPTGYVVTS